MSAKSLGILLAVTAFAVVTALLLSGEDRQGIPSRGQLVFPELKEQINQVSRIEVAGASGAVTIARSGEAWEVKEKDDYRAAMDTVRSVVIGLADLSILEPKTKNPEHHAKLGLQSVTADGSAATQVTLKDGEGATMASVLIGNRKPSRADSTRDEIYLRKADDDQTWLAFGRVRPEKEPIGWIDTRILDIDTQRVRQIRITHADGHTILLRKEKPDDADFRLLGVPKKAEIRSQFSVNDIADSMAHLTLDDVQPRGQVTLAKKGRLLARLETFDGLRLTMTMVEQDGRHHALLSAEFDRKLIHEPPPVPEEKGKEDADTSERKTDPSREAEVKVSSPEVVEQEAERLQGQLAEWVYVIPKFRANTLATRTEDLIKK